MTVQNLKTATKKEEIATPLYESNPNHQTTPVKRHIKKVAVNKHGKALLRPGKNGPRTCVYWTAEEHQRFVEGVEKFGPKDVKNISKVVGTRTPTQCRTHMQKYLLHKNKWDNKHKVDPMKASAVTAVLPAHPAPSASTDDLFPVTHLLEDDDTSSQGSSVSLDSSCSYASSLGSEVDDDVDVLVSSWETILPLTSDAPHLATCKEWPWAEPELHIHEEQQLIPQEDPMSWEVTSHMVWV